MTEDIKIKISSDDAQAVASFKRLSTEGAKVQSNLKGVGTEGKQAGKALKDMASMVSPELARLGDLLGKGGDNLEKLTAGSMAAKAGLVGLVAVGSFQLGRMLSDFIFQTQEFEAQTIKSIDSISKTYEYIGRQQKERFTQEIELAQLASSDEQKNAELSALRNRTNNELAEARIAATKAEMALNRALANDLLGYGKEDNALAEQGLKLAQERVTALEQQADMVDRLRHGGSEIEEQIKQRKAEAEAMKEQAAAMAKQEEAQKRLLETQENYLFNLDAELVRLKEGEEAYLKLTLAKQGFNEESIESAVRIKAEIERMKELSRIKEPRDEPEKSLSVNRISQIGSVQSEQQRFLTRGPGMQDQDKILAATNKQLEAMQRQAKLLQDQNRLLSNIEKRLPTEAA
jgi:hypothetical protein